MKKTIMHIVEAAGGVERYMLYLLKKMKSMSEYEHILVCSNSFDDAKFIGLVSSVYLIDSMHNKISIFDDLLSVFKIRKVIKKVKPDIIYCHSSKAGAVGRLANLFINNKTIYNAHGWAFNIKGANRIKLKIYELVERILAYTTNVIVCISEYEKISALEHKICKRNKLVVIKSGIDFDEYKNIILFPKEKLGLQKDSFVVGTVGRLSAQKAPDSFIKMAVLLKRQIPNSFFVMVGTGDQYNKVLNMINKYNLSDSFLITGWVDNPLDYVGIFDVAVLLSRWEGFGLVLPEYMIMEKPIVATKADAIPYVVNDSAMLIDIDDYESAAKAIIKIYNDDDIRKQLIRNGKERVKKLDANRMAKKHMMLIEKLLSN